MDKWFSQGLGQITEFWRGLTNAQKIRIGVIFLLSAAAIGLLLSYAMRTEYSAVFTGLSDQDAGEMTNKLTEFKIPNRVSTASNGTINVMVPTAKVTEARLQLASAGLPKGSASISDMKDIPITSTEQQRRYLYQMALQGELERTLMRIEGVQAAKVNLNIPEKSLFIKANESREPSAAVVLTLKPGVQLDTGQIQGVIHLVAHSVEGLKTQNITLTDQNGRRLYRDNSTPGNEIGAHREQEQAVSRELQENVQSLFDQVFGLGNVDARVNVVMDFDQSQQTTKTYTPPIPGSREGIVENVERMTETFKGTSSGAAPGTASNIPGAAATQSQGSQNSSEKSQEKINYLVNEITESVVKSPQIKDLSVAVAVNTKKIKLDDQLTQSIRGTVASATGANLQKVTILGYDFVPAIDPAEVAEFKAQAQRERLFTMASIPAVVLVTGFVLFKLYGAWQRRRREEEERARLVALQPDVRLPERQLSSEERQRLKVQEELGKIARQKPEDFAQLLKAWLDEE